MDNYPNAKDILVERMHLRDVAVSHWFHHDLFSCRWWLLLIVTIIPWILWWRIVDRERKYEILCYGLILCVVSTFLDVIGTDLLLWGYPHMLIASVPPLFPTDYTVLPVVGMLIFQYYRGCKEFFMVSVIVSWMFSFAFEPILEFLGIYEIIHWKHIYSFILYVIMFNSIRFFILKYGTNKKF